MSNCKKFKNYIEQYIEGIISDTQLAKLKEHTQTCQSCREEFEQCVLMQETIKDAFTPKMSAEQAGASIVSKLSSSTKPVTRRTGFRSIWLTGWPAAAAAGIILVAGLIIGFAFGRSNIVKTNTEPAAAKVPMHITNLQGTILVRHDGADIWQPLTTDSNVYVGDMFHSASNSTFVLNLKDNSTIEVEQNSMLALTSYNGETQFFLEHGRCKASLESPHRPFFISTPHGRVEALGTEFTVTVE